MTTITVPKEYGYVVVIATGTCLLSFIQGIRVGLYRRTAGVPYPNAYASAEAIATAEPEKKQALYLFNCAQRSHQNYLENLPVVLASLLVSGVKYPLVATAAGIGWSVFRVVYAFGYTRKDKRDGSGRLDGGTFWLFQFILLGLFGKTGYDLATA